MKKTIFTLSVFLITYTSCKKPLNCNQSVLTGEAVMFPVTFIGFAPQEINIIRVYRINPANPGKIDTFNLDKILWGYSAHSDKEHFTDRALDGNTEPTYSYLDKCTLIWDWQTKRDTLSDFAIVKKIENSTTDKCHKDDPIIKLSNVSYTYKGKRIFRDSSITIYK